MRPSTQRGSPRPRRRWRRTAGCRAAARTRPTRRARGGSTGGGSGAAPELQARESSSRAQESLAVRATPRPAATSSVLQRPAAPRSSRASAARGRPGACACRPRPRSETLASACHLFLNWPEASSSVRRARLEPAEVPLVLARELDRVAAEGALRRRLRPAEEHLVGDQVGLAEVADVVQVEPRRVPVEVVGEAQPAGVGAAEAHRAAVAGERGARSGRRRGGSRRAAGSSGPRSSAGRGSPRGRPSRGSRRRSPRAPTSRFAKWRVKSIPPVVAWVGRKASAGSPTQRWVEVSMPPRLVLPLSQSLWRRPTV